MTKKYDPRIEHEWVPAFLAVFMTIAKVCFIVIPAFITNVEIQNTISELTSDQAFNTVWIMVVTFWVGKQVVGTKEGAKKE